MSTEQNRMDGIQSSKSGVRLAQELIEAEEIRKEVLQEAVNTGTESGRSICGSSEDVKEPTERSYGSVVLQGCPIDHRGLLHGGGGHDLQSPQHSLIDMSNVVFGYADASMVAGTRQSDVFIAPSEEDEDEVRAIFRNALGADVSSPSEVKEAIQSGKVTNIASVRTRIRQQLPGLFDTVATPVQGVGGSMAVRASSVSAGGAAGALKKSRERAANVGEGIVRVTGEAFTFDLSNVEVNLAQTVVSQFADAVVLVIFFSLLGGRPQDMVRKQFSSSGNSST